jgi:hypothetical protein
VIRIRNLVVGTIVTALLVAGAAALSAWPSWRATPEGMAVVKLSFAHGAERSCRARTAEEMAKLPPNMRRREICDRRRPPVHVALEIDGAPAFAAAIPPTGFSGDGPSRVYEAFLLPAGTHGIALGLRDTAGDEGFTHTANRTITLAPGQSLAIDFDATADGFVFH